MTTVDPIAQPEPRPRGSRAADPRAADQPGSDRRIALSTAANMRDLGGLEAGDRPIGRDRLFRSASLARLGQADQHVLTDLGITTVFDLRTDREREAAPDRLPGTIGSVHLDVLADDAADTAAGLAVLGGDARRITEALSDGRALALMTASYRKFVELDSARRAFRALLTSLADPRRSGAALFHCTTGKDRTGWATVVLLRILGVSEEDIVADYLQTNTDLLPALRPVLEKAEADGVPAEILRPVLGVRTEYLDAADQEVRNRYGTFERYLSAGLEIEGTTVAALRERFLS